jgi:RNA recognition motif-containing protein
MNQQNSRHSGRRSNRGPRRNSSNPRNESRQPAPPPANPSLWQRIVGLFGGGSKTSNKGGASAPRPREENRGNGRGPSRQSRPPESVEVTTPKLYVGNLSFDAAESDLFELFKGVGAVRNAEVVTNKYNDKSKGFGFVTMASVDEAKRAVVELHDKDFLGRKLVVSGAKSSDRESDYRN